MTDHTELRSIRRLEDLGIPVALVHDLALRRALFEGRTSSLRLAEALCISPQLMVDVVEELRQLRYFEVLGLENRDYQLTLTNAGKEMANDRMRLCRYAGPAPVSLAAYSATVRAQKVQPKVTAATMRQAFRDLVVNSRLLDELGPSMLAEGAMFLYGPPGTGKTSIAERLNLVHDDTILVPHAVEVDSQIITVFDPVVHRPVEQQPADLDPRWVLCRRPSIIAGGELNLSQLDLTYEPSSGVYIAPLQMQANNGIFVIDDFGRQAGLTPEQLLNRWIVPLDRRIDYLSLNYGLKFEIPFDAKIVFSTNLEPASLGDEAFFRRIQNKIFVPPMEDAEFDEVLFRVTTSYGIRVDPAAPAYLRRMSRELGDGDLRPYLPKEIAKILASVCEYHGRPLVLDRANVDRVGSVYFTKLATLGSVATGKERAAAADAAPITGETLFIDAERPAPAPPVDGGGTNGRMPSMTPDRRMLRHEPTARPGGPNLPARSATEQKRPVAPNPVR